MEVAWNSSGTRGPELLLEHCSALERLEQARPSPVARLEQVLGARLARLLVTALAGDHGMRSRDLD